LHQQADGLEARSSVQSSANFIEAKDIRAGDCLHTADGEAVVHSAKHIDYKDEDEVYSIKLAGSIGTVAIGGVFTHAIGHIQLRGAHNVGARTEFKYKDTSKTN